MVLAPPTTSAAKREINTGNRTDHRQQHRTVIVDNQTVALVVVVMHTTQMKDNLNVPLGAKNVEIVAQ